MHRYMRLPETTDRVGVDKLLPCGEVRVAQIIVAHVRVEMEALACSPHIQMDY